MKKRLLPLLLACFLLAACGEQDPADMWAPWVPEAPSLKWVQTDLSTIAVPEGVKVVGLGEASHGVKEYQEMKGEVFRALVENNGCRSFIIEGDFGSALIVDEYIHGGEGTAQEAANQIGFRIYQTEEMANILEWMRQYNETAPEGEDLHFYGMDIQWADASKDYLFQVLHQVPALEAEVQASQERLEILNDDAIPNLTAQELEQAGKTLENLSHRIVEAQEEIKAVVGEQVFAFAQECDNSLFQCCVLWASSELEYNDLRDTFMAWKVQWYLDQGDGSLLFINGHNGHIAKEGETTYPSLGQHLREDLGPEAYFAIGTNAAVTSYNVQGDDGSFTQATVENNDPLTRLATQLKTEQGEPYYYADFSKVRKDSNWKKLLSQNWSMTSLNVGPSFFTAAKIVPEKAYDGMIVFDSVSPTTLKLEQ